MLAASEEQKSVVEVMKGKDGFINRNIKIATFAIKKNRLGLNAGGIP